MRRILFVCMLMLVAVGTQAQAQAYQSPVAFIPEQAMVGKKLTVTYNTELTELKGSCGRYGCLFLARLSLDGYRCTYDKVGKLVDVGYRYTHRCGFAYIEVRGR